MFGGSQMTQLMYNYIVNAMNRGFNQLSIKNNTPKE